MGRFARCKEPQPDFSTDSPRPYFYEYLATGKCVSVSQEATEAPMKLPALWILSAFAAGIGIAERWPAPLRLWAALACLGISVSVILLATFLAWRGSVVAAWVCALVAWVAIGGMAAGVERGTVPSNHIARLIAPGRVDPGIALRWRGRLREDPLALPWEQRFEIDLAQVEAQGVALSTSGGLRVNFYPGARVAQPPTGLRAGDRVEVLVKAQPPRDYLDPGAFDVKGFLARERIDVIGSLRSGELLQLVDRPPPTISQRLARARGLLLARLDSPFVGQPGRGAVARAMLLGDRSFVDSSVVLAFQKTAAYHVLVVAGLHVGALLNFLWWVGERPRFSMRAGLVLGNALSFCIGLFIATVDWFAHWPRLTYRIPGPPLWLVILFFVGFIFLAAVARTIAARRRDPAKRRQWLPAAHPVQ
jgi:hypothetical protein